MILTIGMGRTGPTAAQAAIPAPIGGPNPRMCGGPQAVWVTLADPGHIWRPAPWAAVGLVLVIPMVRIASYMFV